MKLGGWGRFPVHEARLTAPRDEASLLAQLQEGKAIARGNGRAYGDSAVSCQNTVHMRHFNRMIAFDAESGQLVAEAGVLLADIISAFLPRGWFPAVTPGTKFVTLGGMIAADVHGKNHHLDGSCGQFIDWIDLIDGEGTLRRCSREENRDLFEWTVGGMGLTGVILRAAMRLKPVESGWIRQTMIPAPDLDAAMNAFESSQDATYSVAWIDCLSSGSKLGRSLVMLGEHATRGELDAAKKARPFETGAKRKKSVPFDAPSFALNSLTVRAFNLLYYWNGARKAGTDFVDWDTYFYPLDAILGWNRIYGRRGFLQFQCALPLDRSRDGLRALLEAISRAGAGSFLAVLKRFGEQESRFSFPMLGYTLALDFPISRKTLNLMDHLDRITVDHGGRFYLAKDSRMSAKTLAQSDARAAVFSDMRAAGGLKARFKSEQSERLSL
ncbi:putative decaprenylphosphoryl-beta-D-ribose oxidase [Hartmannibacter diazotrophicus]|uniref:Putative decaprenylphosphoryl-beta-D-ribose oxidase n=1 Tax=Hartmannibacter diazotrophicus TaxID=1482074 RepID=A0A2C9DCS8_9HYPH|nr:FAD-binding oxidoreductase [Hartmannibacter diazotrophicus]SON57979.1 putative decaprenylphosphoryl-beta-D-ribose oxidase [Hartmannibacter diazotrophicus]